MRKKLLIPLGIAMKLALFLIFLKLNPLFGGKGLIATLDPDSLGYYQPVENWLEFGVLAAKNHLGNYVLGRMPGMAVVYLPLRLLAARDLAMNLTILLQVLLDGLSVYCLARAAELIFESRRMFGLVFVVYGLCSFVSIHDCAFAPESFGASAAIFALYFLVRGLKAAPVKAMNLALSGLFLTWLVFLRPFWGTGFAVFGLAILWDAHRRSLPPARVLLLAAAFAAPFLLIDSAWTARNWVRFHRLVPLEDFQVETPELPSPIYGKLSDFVRSWGGNPIHWNPEAEMVFFMPRAKFAKAKYAENLPERAFCSAYTLEDLKKLRVLFQVAYQDDRVGEPGPEQVAAQKQFMELATRYREAYFRERPIQAWILAPLWSLKLYLIHPGTYNLSQVPFAEMSAAGKLFKIGQSLIYLLTLGLSALAFGWLVLRRRAGGVLAPVLAFMAAYCVFFFPIILRSVHYRYLVTSFPFLIVLASYPVMRLLEARCHERHQSEPITPSSS